MSLFPVGRYKFIQKDEICDGKSVIFVKLTDSAHRTLNEFFKNRDSCTETPTIEFKDESGIIELPTNFNGTSRTESCTTKFKFDVESNMAMQGSQGRFECIKHNHGSEDIRKYGLLKKRLKIHANDDVFETTKIRMAEVELDKRKVCTKKIDLKHDTVNRRTKVEKSPNLRTSLNSETGLVKPATPKLTQSRNRNQNMLNKLNSPISRRPLKERLIHLLAVKPMKKLELSVALRKGGLRDSDKALFHSTLMSIATVKDNVHHLLRHVWNDVSEDWLFYSEDEREQMKRNKSQNTILPNNTQSPNSNLSPKLHFLADWSPSRPGYIKGVDGLPTKRLRISHFNRPNSVPMKLSPKNNDDNNEILASRLTHSVDHKFENSSLSNIVSRTSPLVHRLEIAQSEVNNVKKRLSAFDAVVSQEFDERNENICLEADKNEKSRTAKRYNGNSGKGRRKNCVSKTIEKTDTFLKEEDPNSETMEEKPKITKKTLAQKQDCDFDKVEEENCHSETKEEADMFALFPISDSLPRICSSDSDETSSYTEEYVTITNVEQRRQYKNDFLEYYSEYKIANNSQMQVHDELIHLQKVIRQHEEGSPEYLLLHQRIMQLQTQLMDKRYRYLRKLLTRIKQLVCEYDEKMS